MIVPRATEVTNRRGKVTVAGMGKRETMNVSDSDGAYLKFANYLQAQNPFTGYDIDYDDDWADFYDDYDITRSTVTFSNVKYTTNN